MAQHTHLARKAHMKRTSKQRAPSSALRKTPLSASRQKRSPSRRRGITGQSLSGSTRVVSRGVLSIVIPVTGTAPRLPALIQRLRSWQAVKEVMVIVNNAPAHTVSSIRRAKAQVISYNESLGHDTGRAIGALYSTGQYVLFLDADINWTLAELKPFLRRLEAGADIALNRYPLPQSARYHHPTAAAKRALNIALNRPDLRAASMTTVPNAVRQSVIEKIGVEYLAVPPVFFTRAALSGCRIETAAFCQVGARNPQPRRRSFSYSVKDLILGDHAEAFAHLINTLGPRGYFPDSTRNRDLLPPSFTGQRENKEAGNNAPKAPWIPFLQRLWNETKTVNAKAIAADTNTVDPSTVDPSTMNTSTMNTSTVNANSTRQAVVVIPTRNEARTIRAVVRRLGTAGVGEIHVVNNGSADKTGPIAARAGAVVHEFEHALGHDVPRAMGVINAQAPGSRAALFVDGDFVLHASQVRPFIEAVTTKGVDVALNNLARGVQPKQQLDPVSTMKRCLNLMIGRPDLRINSPTAVPNALSTRALEHFTPLDLAVPPRMTVRSVLCGLTIRSIRYVDVIRPNRRRPTNRRRPVNRQRGSPARVTSSLSAPVTRLIVGDHLEALSLYLAEKGPRAGFVQPRRLDILAQAIKEHANQAAGTQ